MDHLFPAFLKLTGRKVLVVGGGPVAAAKVAALRPTGARLVVVAPEISDAIGEIEVERLKESRSMGLLGSKKSYAMEIATKALIMPSEISGLEPLHGFIKQENRVVPVFFRLAKKRSKQPEFIERKMPQAVPRPTPPVPATPVQPPPAKSVQASLPLADPPSLNGKPKEGFVWDESKGID